MKYVTSVLSGFAALAMCASPALAQDDILTLEPSSPWVLDYADDSCALRRAFGEAGQEAWLEMRQFSPGINFQITFGSDAINRRMLEPVMAFEPNEQGVEVPSAIFADFGEGKGVYFNFAIGPVVFDPDGRDGLADINWTDAERAAREAEITGILLEKTFASDLRFVTGPMDQTMLAMRGCMDELLLHWGIDVEAHRSLSRPVEPKRMRSWAQRIISQYPQDMLREGNSGYVRVRLIVNEEGRAQSCHLQLETEHPEFEEAACDQLLRHARFDPALDAVGNPIVSYWVTSILYLVN